MSLIRQITLLLAGVILLALLGGVTLNVVAARATLQTQLQLKNADNAGSLALALSQHKGDATTMELLVAAQFDTGHYLRIRLADPRGKVLVERVGAAPAGAAPAWFTRALPIESVPGVAQVSDGWRPIGTIEVQSHAAYAHDAMWAGAVRAAGWMALVGLLAGLVAALGVGRVRRPLQAVVDQAQALQEGRFVHVGEPRAPELNALARAMNALVERLRGVFDAQARLVDDLRHQAERDLDTGCLSRRVFLARVQAALGGERVAAGGLVLARVAGLEEMNRRLGRLAADERLHVVAEAFTAYEARVPGCLPGRLNGADFALYLPASGLAGETGRALAEALRASLGAMDAKMVVHVGSAELDGLAELGDGLAAVDEALGRAEAQGPFSACHRDLGAAAGVVRSQAEWRERIVAALAADGAAELAAFPVVDREGKLVHLECPLRLRLEDGGPAEPAATWLSHALRGRLSARVDLLAAELALRDLATDPRPRNVNVALESISTPGFVAQMRRRLLAAPVPARALWLELPERALRQCPDLLADAARQWGEAGAHVGIEHAGGDTAELGRLFELELNYVKLDRRHTHGIAADVAVRQMAIGLVTLLRGLGLMVIAEGVRDRDDLAVLWELGFDAATGPAVTVTR